MNDHVSLSRKSDRGTEPLIDFPPDFLDGWGADRSSLSKETRKQEDTGEPQDLYRRRLAVTYILCVFFGYTGAHKFYLRKPRVGLVYLGVGVVGIGGWLLLSGWILGALLSGFFLMTLILFLALDLWTIPRQLRKNLDPTGRKANRPSGRRERRRESDGLMTHKPAERHAGRVSLRRRVERWIETLGR